MLEPAVRSQVKMSQTRASSPNGIIPDLKHLSVIPMSSGGKLFHDFLALQALYCQLHRRFTVSHSTDSFTESGTRPSKDTPSYLHLSTGGRRRMT